MTVAMMMVCMMMGMVMMVAVTVMMVMLTGGCVCAGKDSVGLATCARLFTEQQ